MILRRGSTKVRRVGCCVRLGDRRDSNRAAVWPGRKERYRCDSVDHVTEYERHSDLRGIGLAVDVLSVRCWRNLSRLG